MPIDLNAKACLLTAAIPGSSPAKYLRSLSVTGMHWSDAAGSEWFALALLSVPEPEAGQTGILGSGSDIHLGGGAPCQLLSLQGVFPRYVVGAFIAPAAVASITSSGTTATLTTTSPQGLSGSINISIFGAAQDPYDGVFRATVTGASTLTYPVTGSPASPATLDSGYTAITWCPVIFCAKNYKLDCARTIDGGADGTAYSLSYAAAPSSDLTAFIDSTASGNCVRTKLGTSGPGSGLAEAETVAPEWLIGDIFYALPAATGLSDPFSNPVNYVIVGESRNWTAIPT